LFVAERNKRARGASIALSKLGVGEHPPLEDAAVSSPPHLGEVPVPALVVPGGLEPSVAHVGSPRGILAVASPRQLMLTTDVGYSPHQFKYV